LLADLPDYLERTCGALASHGADMVKLASWMGFEANARVFAHFDPERDGAWGAHSRRWGYGFSYVYTAETARACPFPPISHGEDYAMALAASAAGRKVLGFSDEPPNACVVHVSHSLNTSLVRGAVPCDGDGGGLFSTPCSHLLDAAVAFTRLLAQRGSESGLVLGPSMTDTLGGPLKLAHADSALLAQGRAPERAPERARAAPCVPPNADPARTAARRVRVATMDP
jgi:hypothetical protein